MSQKIFVCPTCGASSKRCDPETELRAIWTIKGVPKERQDQMVAEIEAKAKPGAMVGPFRIGGGKP